MAKRKGGGSAADNTNALYFGGENPIGKTNETESYNGSSWTEVNNLNTQEISWRLWCNTNCCIFS